jgi:hypothetical protein
MKSGYQTTGNANVISSDESSFTLFPRSGRGYIWRTAKETYSPECLVPTVKYGGSSMIVWAAISWRSVGPIVNLHGRITARECMERPGNQAHTTIQTSFLNSDAVFQEDNPPFTQLEELT